MTALTLEQAIAHVTTTNPTFEVETVPIRGVSQRVFKNIPPTVTALLQASIPAHGDGTWEYLIFEDERWTFAEFCDDVKTMAHALQHDLGVRPGDRVAIAMRNYPEFLVLIMAIAAVGGVVVFVNAWWTAEELNYAFEDSAPGLVFADGPRAERILPLCKVRNLRCIGVRDGERLTDRGYGTLRNANLTESWPEPVNDTEDDFAIMYSSGTTGRPKGVVLTHRGAVNAVFTWLMQAVMEPLITPGAPDAPPKPRPSVLVTTPLFHITATHPVFLLSLPAGAKVAMIRKWDPEEALRIIKDEQITRFLGVPTQSADLMELCRERGETLPSLDFIGAGGAKRAPAQVALIKETFPAANPATGWGMTETNAIGIGLVGDEYIARPGAVGRLYPPLQDLRFLDDDGLDVPQGEVGEIAVKGPSVMRCYLNQPEATAEVLQNGWLRTGDMGFIDADGIVTIVDRKKNIIIRGGENIACLDVEAAIHRHPDVIEACAFSVPHDRLGEVVGAAIQLRNGSILTDTDLRAFLSEHIAHFKIPDHLWFQHDEIPRAATDKPDRRGLRDTLLQTLNKETV